MYKKWPLDVLESSFFINLGLLSFVVYHIRTSASSHEHDLSAVINTSFSIVFVTFLGIVIYHAYIVLTTSEIVSAIAERLRKSAANSRESVQPTLEMQQSQNTNEAVISTESNIPVYHQATQRWLSRFRESIFESGP